MMMMMMSMYMILTMMMIMVMMIVIMIMMGYDNGDDNDRLVSKLTDSSSSYICISYHSIEELSIHPSTVCINLLF